MKPKLTRFEMVPSEGVVIVRLAVPSDDGSRTIDGEASVPLEMDKTVRSHVDAAWEDGLLGQQLVYRKAVMEAEIKAARDANLPAAGPDKTPEFVPKRIPKASPE